MTAEELIALVRMQHGEEAHHTMATLNRWLARGDGVAVYTNLDLCHPDVGECLFVSYGSPDAQLETWTAPEQLPDIGGLIGWRYALKGTYQGVELELDSVG